MANGLFITQNITYNPQIATYANSMSSVERNITSCHHQLKFTHKWTHLRRIFFSETRTKQSISGILTMKYVGEKITIIKKNSIDCLERQVFFITHRCCEVLKVSIIFTWIYIDQNIDTGRYIKQTSRQLKLSQYRVSFWNWSNPAHISHLVYRDILYRAG